METNTDSIHSLSGERYRCASLRRFAVGDNSELVYYGDRSAHVIPSRVANVLESCRSFQTIEHHVNQISSRLRAGQEGLSSLRKLLRDFVQIGMLVPEQKVLRPARLESAGTTDRIASVGVITRDRTAQLKRALTSYINNIKQHGRSIDFVVADGSDNADTRNEHRLLLQRLSAEHGVRMWYAGLEEKSRYAKILKQTSDVPPEVIDFALFDIESCGNAAGANRNALLLHTVGDLFFSVDDDTVCTIAEPFEREDGLTLSEGIPTQTWFFATREEALGSAKIIEKDLLGTHEQLLGKDLASVISGFANPSSMTPHEISSYFMKSLEAGTGRVYATFNGIFGNSGMPSPVAFLSAMGESRRRFVQSHEDYQRFRSSREVLRVAKSTSIYRGMICLGTSLGLDNRSLLPPFMPVQRNQDGLFGLTTNLCFDDACFGHLPVAILHAAEGRSNNPDFKPHVPGLSLTDILYFCVLSHRFAPGLASNKDRMRSLGKYLVHLGGIPLSDFEDFLRLESWERMSVDLRDLEQLLKLYNEKPDYWATDLKKWMAAMRYALPSKHYLTARDLRTERSEAGVRVLTQRLVRKFGDLLCWWPAIVTAAKQLRASGMRIAELV